MTHILDIQILLGCDTVALGVQLLVSVVPSLCVSSSWRRVLFDPKAKAQHSFQTSGTTHPMTQCHIPDDLPFQQHDSYFFIVSC